MKRSLKKNYKLILGMIIGVIISGVGVYAATTISSSNISYDNSKSGLTSTNMKGAIDELYEKMGDYNTLNTVKCNVANGNGANIGNEIQCGTESFYIINIESQYISMISKYNLAVGSDYDLASGGKDVIIEKNGLQNKYCVGQLSTVLSSSGFRNKYTCINGSLNAGNYLNYLKLFGVTPKTTTISEITLSQLKSLGCTSTGCSGSVNKWIYSLETYKIQDKDSSGYPCYVDNGNISCGPTSAHGIRPVVRLSKSDINNL